MSKPDTITAMADLIKAAREKIPFHLSFEGHCVGECDECPHKLLELLDMQLALWDGRLKKGVVPNLGDVHTLARDCKEVYSLLESHGLVKPLNNNYTNHGNTHD